MLYKYDSNVASLKSLMRNQSDDDRIHIQKITLLCCGMWRHWMDAGYRVISALNLFKDLPYDKEASGCMNTGELIAVLGASGAGKTTLLAAVSQRLRGNSSGDISLNGKIIAREEMSTISSFLPQFDIPVQTLTAFEYLYFMSHFKMDKDTTKLEKIEKVNSLLQSVGLKYAVNYEVKCMSGGERKRLSLAEELITDPPFVFCDEPTTGLDSYNAFSVIKTLRQLTSPGMRIFSSDEESVTSVNDIEMQIILQEDYWWYGNGNGNSFTNGYNRKQRAGIMCSIHQPTSDVFELFTHIILMDQGRIIYYGSTDDACLFFSKLGLFCPVNCNPAEFYVKVTSIDNGNFSEIIRNNFEQELYSKPCSVQWMSESFNFDLKIKPRRKINWFYQVYFLLLRIIIETGRNMREQFVSAGFFLITSIILAVMYSKVPAFTQSSIQDIEGCFFMASTEVIFSFSYGTTYIFPSELPIMRRGAGEGIYSLSAYYVSQILAQIPKSFILSYLFFGLLYAYVDFSKGFLTYFSISTTLGLSGVTGTAYGMLLSSIFESDSVACELAGPFDILFLLFGGLYLNVNSVPYLKYISMFFYASEAMAYDYWYNVDFIDCSQKTTCFKNGTEVLEKYSFNSDPLTKIVDYSGLIAIALVFHLLAFIGIRKYVNKRGYY